MLKTALQKTWCYKSYSIWRYYSETIFPIGLFVSTYCGTRPRLCRLSSIQQVLTVPLTVPLYNPVGSQSMLVTIRTTSRCTSTRGSTRMWSSATPCRAAAGGRSTGRDPCPSTAERSARCVQRVCLQCVDTQGVFTMHLCVCVCVFDCPIACKRYRPLL